MSVEAILVVILAVAGAVVALAGALFVRRSLSRAGVTLRGVDERLHDRRATLPAELVAARARLSTAARGDTERALWTLARLDARIETLRADLRERRAASDTLRANMLRNRGALVRVRNSARMLIRAIELRREFLE